MEVYVVDPLSGYGFGDIVEEYESLVWTERHIDAGELQLVIPATEDSYQLMTPGLLLGQLNSQELMIVETREVKDGMLTAKGRSFETFFEERIIIGGTVTDTPGGILQWLFENMLANQYGTDIPGLTTGFFEQGDGTKVTETFETGQAYAAMLQIAKKYGLNIAVYRKSVVWGHELAFSAHMGKDRTSDQSVNPLVQFSPSLDNLGNAKELMSDIKYKTVALAIPPDLTFTFGGEDHQPQPIYESKVDGFDPFHQRVVPVDCTDITMDQLGPSDSSDVDRLGRLYDIMHARALKVLRKTQRVHIVDGEITPESPYKYEGDNPDSSYESYGLGDRVEIQGHYGPVRKAIITEHVRSRDSSGERTYPTLSDKRTPVLRQGLAEQVLAYFDWGPPFGNGSFWSEASLDETWDTDVLAIAKPTRWEADPGMMLAPGIGHAFAGVFGTLRTDAVKLRFRWSFTGLRADNGYLEYDAPSPARLDSGAEVQSSVDEFTTEDDAFISWWVRESEGDHVGALWLDTGEWLLPEDNPTPSRMWSGWTLMPADYDTPENPRRGWWALTQLYPAEVSVET